MISAAVAGLLLVGCKGHGSSSIPQALTNWVWESGSNAANSLGYYASMGSATTTGYPSGRYAAMTWKDSGGQFWVFSGAGAPNDMWKFNTSTLQWTWMTSPATGTTASPASYGTLQTAAASNLPGARNAGSTWTDASGNLWMFGGYGTDTNGLAGYMNDMWSYSPTTGWWTWVNGSASAGSLAPYEFGTMGTASSLNQPNPRSNAASWTSQSGVFYLFGGEGYLNSTVGVQNDLWSFSPANGWAWIGGSNVLNGGGNGVYGTKGTASATNQPGARQSATTWTDSSGNFWMFGGTGIDSVGSNGQLNDLWSYSTTTNQWTWVNGNATVNGIGSYGTNNAAATTNQPGARSGATGWVDTSGNFWLFGGYGINSTGTLVILNDLWEYQTSSKEWVWLNGSYNGNITGYYGAINSASSSNMPGSRYYASGWTDSSGVFWIFGGLGYDAVGTNGRLSDVWKFTP